MEGYRISKAGLVSRQLFSTKVWHMCINALYIMSLFIKFGGPLKGEGAGS